MFLAHLCFLFFFADSFHALISAEVVGYVNALNTQTSLCLLKTACSVEAHDSGKIFFYFLLEKTVDELIDQGSDQS